ncbi:MAG: DegT/DnrJ/EryC1/StrS aminotransferase family protein [Candidatus Omnitrophota bacterium]|nr:DegT/DnrJ/EryC1/StrS aminotransferase family protein [Candidatus Omnitrophota bacterium]
MKEKTIPHSRPTLGEEEINAVTEVIRSGHITQGEKVKEFEEELARFVGVKGAVATNSGTSALHLGLLALGLGKGDGVLLPSYVCSSPLNAIYQTGVQPVLCDIELESFNISLESIEDRRTENTKAVIVPHMFGSPADLEKIENAGVTVVEDCAHSIGALYGDRKTGSIGSFSILSFYINKMLACGEGGAILSNDEDMLNFARDRRSYDEKEDYKVRYNYKMTDMQAALGLVQLKKLPEMIKKRKEIAECYTVAFADLDIVLPRSEFDNIFYRYVIKTPKDIPNAIALLREKDVTCARPVFTPLHRYFELRSGFRNTDEAYSSALSIPIYPSLTEEEQLQVIEAVKETLG